MNECIKLLLDESVIFIFDPAALPPQIAETAQLGIPSWAAWAIWAPWALWAPWAPWAPWTPWVPWVLFLLLAAASSLK